MERFGHIRTLALEQHIGELNAQMYEWRKNLSGATCNHRRDALMNVVRVLYGSRAASGLSDLVTFPKAPPKPRALDRSHIADVIRKVEPGSKLRARLELMQWTGMRPSQMGRLTPEDFKLDAEIPHVISMIIGGVSTPTAAEAQQPTPVIERFEQLDMQEATGWLLLGTDSGTGWVPGMAVLCEHGRGPRMDASLGPFPLTRRPVQFAIRTPDGAVERYGPVMTAGPESGFHDPQITNRAEVLRMARAALQLGSLISNGYNSFWNQASAAANRTAYQTLAACR